MKIVNFTVEEKVYEEFREQLNRTACLQPQVLRAAIRSYIKGDLKFDRGELVSTKEPVVQVIHEKKSPGRPAQEKEPVKEETVPYKFNPKLDIWDQDYSNATFADIRERAWGYKELNTQSEHWLSFLTEGKTTGGTFEQFVITEYLNERPKYTKEEWLLKEYVRFLGRAASFFLLKNKYKNYGFSVADVWNDAMLVMENWDKWLVVEGKLPPEPEEEEENS